MKKKYSAFFSLKPDKQERIINAAIKEFSENGFDNASTNKIVELAHISKGLIFHYFHSKKDLFLFVYGYALDTIMKDFIEKIDFSEKDLLMRIKNMALLKIELINKYPHIFNFIIKINLQMPNTIMSDLKSLNSDITTLGYTKLLDNIDITCFRAGLDINSTINIIMWTIEGFSNSFLEKNNTLENGSLKYDNVISELDNYITIFRSCFYKTAEEV